MSRAGELADLLERRGRAFADFLSALSPEQWTTRCGNHPTIRVGDEDENRPVGTVAHHTVVALPRQLRLLRAIVDGVEVPRPSPGGVADHARANPAPDQAETTALMRGNTSDIAQALRELSDEELGRTGRTFLGEMDAGQVVERILLGHIDWHEESIRVTLALPRPDAPSPV